MEENKLDKFFREKSEENLPQFDPKYWEQAERMLDNALPEEEDRKRVAWWWLLPLLLISGCGLWWFGSLTTEGAWTKAERNESIKSEESVAQDERTRQNDFENNTKNTDLEDESTNTSSNENTKQIVNSSKKKSNATKNEIAKIAKNISPNNAQNKESAGAEKEDYLANNQANTPSKIPTETPKTVNPDFIKTSPILIPKIPADVPNDKLNELSLLPTLEADFLDIPMTELEDSLDIDPQIQKVLKPKKLRLGWSAEIVVGEKNYGDYVAIALISFRTGLTADYKLNRKLDLHFDLLGRREAESIVTRVNEGEAQGGKAYGFGVTEITNLYRFKTQYFVESAALLRYKINQRHAIGVGIGAKYLFSVRADILQRSKDAQFNFDNYEVSFIERDEVINSGWWEKESTKDLLPFGQLRYDFRTTRHSTLFFKMNAEYNRTWLQRGDLPRRFRLETSLGFNYQF